MKIYNENKEHVKTCSKIYSCFTDNEILNSVSTESKRMQESDKAALNLLFIKRVYDVFITDLKKSAPYEYEYFKEKSGIFNGVKLIERRSSNNYIVFTHDNGYDLRYNENDIPLHMVIESEKR